MGIFTFVSEGLCGFFLFYDMWEALTLVNDEAIRIVGKNLVDLFLLSNVTTIASCNGVVSSVYDYIWMGRWSCFVTFVFFIFVLYF